MLQKLLRIYSYLFAAAAGLAYLALAMMSKISGAELTLDNMPWKGAELTNWLFGLGVAGLIAVVAAVTGSKLRFLLPVFACAVAYITVKGNFASAHSFEGVSDFQRTLALSGGSILGALASLLQLKSPPSAQPSASKL